MKKRLILGMAALAAVTLTSCQKDQVINQVPQEQAIEFGTYTGRDAQTKATVMDLNGLKGANAGFGVYAYYTGQNSYNTDVNNGAKSPANFMRNQYVYWTGELNNGSWTYTPIKYWPKNSGDKITFFAYAPHKKNDNNITKVSGSAIKGDPFLVFVVNEDITKQTDLLYANNDNTDKTKPSNSTITFTFKHALSRIGFSAKAAENYPNTTISINSITINGPFTKKCGLNLNGGIWSSTATETTASYTVNADELYNTESLTTSFVKLNEKNSETSKGHIMIIPKTFGGDGAGGYVTITIDYDVTTEDTNLANDKSVINNVVTTDGLSIGFDKGKAYNIGLTIGLDAVKFDVTSVEDWGEETTIWQN